MTKSKSGSDNLQNAFRDAGGIPDLLKVLRANLGISDRAQEERMDAQQRAVEALFFLTRNNVESRYDTSDSLLLPCLIPPHYHRKAD